MMGVKHVEVSPVGNFWRRGEFWVGGLTFLVRFWLLQSLAGTPLFEPIPGGGDRALYDELAQRVATGHIFPEQVFSYLPLYPWVLGASYALLKIIGLGTNLYVVGLLGAAVDTATVVLIMSLGVRLGCQPVLMKIVALWYAFYPTAIVYSVITMPNTMSGFLLILFVQLCSKLQLPNKQVEQNPLSRLTSSAKQVFAKTSVSRWFGAGLVGGAACLSYGTALFVVCACLIFWLITSYPKHLPNMARLLAFMAGAAIPIIPVSFHNWRIDGHFVLLTAHSGVVFYMGNHEHATGYPTQIGAFQKDAGGLLSDAHSEAERNEGRKLTAAEASAYWSKRAWSFICTHPLAEIKLLGLKLIKFWNRSEHDDIRILAMLQSLDVAFTTGLWPGFGWISWLALTGLILTPRNGLLKLAVVSGVIGVVCFFVTARYRLSLTPLLVVLGGLGLEQICRILLIFIQKRTVEPQQMGVQVVMLLAMGVGVWWPLSQSDFRALDHYNIAAHFLTKGKAREALEQSKKGIALAPGEANLFFVMGNAYYTLGETTAAAASFEETIRLKPSHASAHYNLGQVWMSLNQPAAAAKEAVLALYYDPEHSNAKKLLLEAETAVQAAGAVNLTTGEKKVKREAALYECRKRTTRTTR